MEGLCVFHGFSWQKFKYRYELNTVLNLHQWWPLNVCKSCPYLTDIDRHILFFICPVAQSEA